MPRLVTKEREIAEAAGTLDKLTAFCFSSPGEPLYCRVGSVAVRFDGIRVSVRHTQHSTVRLRAMKALGRRRAAANRL